jgi:hypothetical protein
MENGFLTAKDFIADWRQNIGDTTKEVPEAEIFAFIRKGLRRIAREKGLDKLFQNQDTFELASINTDGTPAATWTLNKGLNSIIDIKDVNFLDTNGQKVKVLCPKYMPYGKFRKKFPVPEANRAGGNPSAFTLLQIQGKTRLIFSCPIDRPYVLDMVYTAFPPMVRRPDDLIHIPYDYLDLLTELVTIFYNLESADGATARALYEDYDKMVPEIREMLAQQDTAVGYRVIGGAY